MRRTVSILAVSICTLMFIVPASTHTVNSRHSPGDQNPPPSELSLCDLSKDIELYQNKVVRVSAIIRGMGGHYPFFVTVNGCPPDGLIMLHVRFHNRKRRGAILQKRIYEALLFNLANITANINQRAEAIIVGRVKRESCDGCSHPRLLISVMDVELKILGLNGGE